MVELAGQDLAEIRHTFYRFFATSLWAPRGEVLARLAQVASGLDQAPLEAFTFYEPWRRLSEALEVGFAISELEQDYSYLFLASFPQVRCPQYESAFLSGDGGRDTGLLIATVEQFYRRLGIVQSANLKELPDHISVELEALAFLLKREARGWSQKDLTAVRQALEQQQSFLRGHLARWLPLFTERVASVGRGGFYLLATKATNAFILNDLDLLEALSKEVVA